MWVRNQDSREFGGGSSAGGAEPMGELADFASRARCILQRLGVLNFKPLVDDKMEDRLNGTEITRAQSPVQPPETFCSQNLASTVETIPVLPCLKLKPRFDHPYGIGRCRCCYSRGDGSLGMDQGWAVSPSE